MVTGMQIFINMHPFLNPNKHKLLNALNSQTHLCPVKFSAIGMWHMVLIKFYQG